MESSIGPSTDRSPIGTSSDIRRPPEGAPNVLLVLIDDAGFGNPSTFGGPIQTPNYTRVAEGGLRYNRFHVTALCSPTRAALVDRAEQPRGRVRIDRRVRRRVPGLLRDPAAGLRAAARGSCGTTDTARPRSGSGI